MMPAGEEFGEKQTTVSDRCVGASEISLGRVEIGVRQPGTIPFVADRRKQSSDGREPKKDCQAVGTNASST